MSGRVGTQSCVAICPAKLETVHPLILPSRDALLCINGKAAALKLLL